MNANIPDLTEKAMLVSLTISAWTARKYDRKATDRVISDFGAAESAGRFNKLLVNLGSVQAYQKVAGAARTFHYGNTLPWIHDGADIISVDHFFTYSEKLRDFEQQFNAAAADFIAQYPALVAQAGRDLGELFNTADYPTPAEIAAKFKFAVKVSPLPSARDFRVQLGADEVEKIKAQLDADIKDGLQGALSEIWQRMHSAVKHLVEKLGDTKGIFRDSLIGNLTELCAVLPKLNIGNDATINGMIADIKSTLCDYVPNELRDDPKLRKQAAAAAADILKKMDSYIS